MREGGGKKPPPNTVRAQIWAWMEHGHSSQARRIHAQWWRKIPCPRERLRAEIIERLFEDCWPVIEKYIRSRTGMDAKAFLAPYGMAPPRNVSESCPSPHAENAYSTLPPVAYQERDHV